MWFCINYQFWEENSANWSSLWKSMNYLLPLLCPITRQRSCYHHVVVGIRMLSKIFLYYSYHLIQYYLSLVTWGGSEHCLVTLFVLEIAWNPTWLFSDFLYSDQPTNTIVWNVWICLNLSKFILNLSWQYSLKFGYHRFYKYSLSDLNG